MFIFPTRFGIKDELPEYWEVLEHLFDGNLCSDFEASANTRIKIQTYISRRKAELGLFCDTKDLDQLINCKGQFQQVPHVVSRCMKQCEIMRIMLAGAWLACSRAIFREKMVNQLVELEKQDFDGERIPEFHEFAEQEAKRLRSDGHSRGKHKWECKIPIFGTTVAVTVDFAGDEAKLLFWGRVLTVAANCGQLNPPMPWETWLASPGSAEGVPSALKLPASLLEPLENCRNTALDLLGERPGQLTEVVKTMRKLSTDSSSITSASMS